VITTIFKESRAIAYLIKGWNIFYRIRLNTFNRGIADLTEINNYGLHISDYLFPILVRFAEVDFTQNGI